MKEQYSKDNWLDDDFGLYDGLDAKLREAMKMLPDALPNIPSLVTKSRQGKQHHVCRVCGAGGDFQTWNAKEMMQGTREVFAYFHCTACDSIQIAEIPEDLGRFYAADYYSYVPPAAGAAARDAHPGRILDVGCGSGEWLCQRAEEYQYAALEGCDPFIEQDLNYPNGVCIRKRTIHQMEGAFNLIHFGDSFEHVSDPLETLRSAKRLLAPGGQVVIDVPVFPNTAFVIYGPYWYQLDAPRHIFLPSEKAMALLAERSGLAVNKAERDSGFPQFAVSYLYQQDIIFPRYWDVLNDIYSPQELELFKHANVLANYAKTSDHIQFTLLHAM